MKEFYKELESNLNKDDPYSHWIQFNGGSIQLTLIYEENPAGEGPYWMWELIYVYEKGKLFGIENVDTSIPRLRKGCMSVAYARCLERAAKVLEAFSVLTITM